MLGNKTFARDASGDVVVIIDPGHGGYEGGTTATNGVSEQVYNWAIAVAMKAELETYSGVKVYLTRGSAEWYSNTGRGRMGAQVGADLFVSVHNNSSPDASVTGLQMYGTINATYRASMETLCNMIAEKLSSLGLYNGGYHTRASTYDASVDYYTMLDEAVKVGIPGLIIEHVFLSNANDTAWLADTNNQMRCGVADATAVAQYYGLSKRSVASGQSLNLTRTYSAYITDGQAGTYTSSNTSVASVRSDGLITAMGEGSAQVSYTGSDGQAKSISVTVPAVYAVALSAGINPTFVDASAVGTFDRNTVMVKLMSSDGSAVQLAPGTFTVGDATSSNGAYDFLISYGGLSCPLRMYGTGAQGSSYANDYAVVGTNSDICVVPILVEGLNTEEPMSLQSRQP